MDAHQRRRIESYLGEPNSAGLRNYIDHLLREDPNNVEFLELAAECSHGSNDSEGELRFRMRAFSIAPTFASLRKLAGVLSRTERWEMAAEAWLNVARARPLDAQAFAEAATALSKLERHELAKGSWECACRIQPHNPHYAAGYADALVQTTSQTPQGSDPKSRKQL